MKRKPQLGKKSRTTGATIAGEGKTLTAGERIVSPGKTRGTAARNTPADAALVPASYPVLLAEIKTRIRGAQIRASLAASREMLVLYWDIGRTILARQTDEGWGARVIDRLSGDLRSAFPEHHGFSPRNLKYMRAFAAAWPDSEFVHQPGAQIPWKHHCMLLDKLSTSEHRLWYAAKAVENGWSRDVLALQIDSALHERQGKAVTNFAQTLPPPQSDLAQQITKDPYLFDFLNLRDDANERAVELGLLEHVEKFLLELGAGFALVGRQVHIEVGGQDFYLDLLFYHLHLRCFLVVDLKARDFTPEAAGKMNFYLSAVDDRFRHAGDQPSIGLILCREKNRVIAEYALRDIQKPVGVSGYVTRLVETLPAPIKDAVPSVADLERELKDVAEPSAPKPKKRP